MLDAAGQFEPSAQATSVSTDVAALHERCGIYTKPSMVARILDAIGWTDSANLSNCRLLEPAAGDGAFVVESARRLVASLQHVGIPLSPGVLTSRIRAFELHEEEAEKGRVKIIKLLLEAGLDNEASFAVAKQWLVTGDFLLSPLEELAFSHVAGNPPYTRWSKIPSALRHAYETALSREIAKGDLFLPFLDRGIASLKHSGRLGFLCSNRWQFMAFAEGFRVKRLPEVTILENDEVDADEAYQRSVNTYPSILVVERRAEPAAAPAVKKQLKTLAEAGFQVRVGPALGCTDAYVLDVNEYDVEAELLAPWLSAVEVRDGSISYNGRRVMCLYDDNGRLRDPANFPLAFKRLLRFKEQLEARSVVRDHGAPWYRPIDRVYSAAWSAPKLLIPELAKRPRVALDVSGAVPSHGVYAIFATNPNANLELLFRKLSEGGLARALTGHAPKVKGGYVRCYKRILENIRL